MLSFSVSIVWWTIFCLFICIGIESRRYCLFIHYSLRWIRLEWSLHSSIEPEQSGHLLKTASLSSFPSQKTSLFALQTELSPEDSVHSLLFLFFSTFCLHLPLYSCPRRWVLLALPASLPPARYCFLPNRFCAAWFLVVRPFRLLFPTDSWCPKYPLRRIGRLCRPRALWSFAEVPLCPAALTFISDIFPSFWVSRSFSPCWSAGAVGMHRNTETLGNWSWTWTFRPWFLHWIFSFRRTDRRSGSFLRRYLYSFWRWRRRTWELRWALRCKKIWSKSLRHF